MRSFRRIAVITISSLFLVAGVVLGFLPVSATLTEIAPELRLITVPCGNVYLRNIPPTQPGDLVALPGESGVYLPRASYVEHCSESVGWRRYAAWGLTAIGALGLAITFSAARTPVGPGGSGRSSRSSSRSGRSARSDGSDGSEGSDRSDSFDGSDGSDSSGGSGGPAGSDRPADLDRSGGPGAAGSPDAAGGPGGDGSEQSPLGRHSRRS
jgi:hypothetical protein